MWNKILTIFILGYTIISYGQEKITIYSPEVIQGQLIKITPPLSEYIPEKGIIHDIVKKENLGTVSKDWPLHPVLNPNALPKGEDPVRQKGTFGQIPNMKAITQNFNGIGYTSVNPADPSVDVGPNHVVQMINGGSGAYLKVFDKTGAQLLAQTYFDGITGIGGLGDPIVIYDQLADRWMLSEFSATGNKLVVGISQTNSPTGSWYIYSFTAPEFPDYPKYSIWPDAYYVTSNESDPAVYALDRTKMINGDPTATMQRFTLSAFPTIGFQAATPVSLSGTTLPPAGTPGLIMRMADDAWSATIPADRLEIYEFHVDFTTPANSNISGPTYLNTAPFDTELCGYTSFSCIDQPGSTNLDPLREVLMNRAFYRNFGTHSSLVCCHATDASGTDVAGVRWYELRKISTNPWNIHQQGTYAPDNTYSRWMSSIAINGNGDIGLAYNVANNTLAPSIWYTGRRACDPLGTMAVAETVIINGGTAGNGSNRYGDYNQLNVDPANDNTFWFTGMYNPTSQWSTRIAAFDFSSCLPEIHFATASSTVNEVDATIDNSCLDYKLVKIPVFIDVAPSDTAFVSLQLSGTATEGINRDIWVVTDSVYLANGHQSDTFFIRVYNDAYVESNENLVMTLVINANGGNAVAASNLQSHTITIISNDALPMNNILSVFNSVNFESGTLPPYTTVNASGATAFQVGTTSQASSSGWTVPATNNTKIAYVNDDACNCNMNDVRLISPALDFSGLDSLVLTYDVYFRSLTYQGNPEDADILISTNGGTSFTEIFDIPGATAWTNRTLNLSAYTGPGFNNVKIAFKYSDGTGWLYGLALDNITLNTTVSTQILDVVNTSTPSIQYLGPLSEVYFYHPTNQKLISRITNMSMHDFGCVTTSVDRVGAGFTNEGINTGDNASKTYYFQAANNLEDSMVAVRLYYNASDLMPWTSFNNNACDSLNTLSLIASETPLAMETGNFQVLGGTMTSTFDNLNYHIQANRIGVNGGFGISDARRVNRAYVKFNATGTNNGSSWEDAYLNLNIAISWAATCPGTNQIRVAKGTYLPTRDTLGMIPSDPRNKTFSINQDVVLVGSFEGNDAAADNADTTLRNMLVNATILQGDLNNNDGSSFANRGDNTYHVVWVNASGNVVLDGFYIKGGNGNEGAGLYVKSNADLFKLNIQDNASTPDGSAVYIVGNNVNVKFKVCNVTLNQYNDIKYGNGSTIIFEGNNTIQKN